jgi:hypothetical protein
LQVGWNVAERKPHKGEADWGFTQPEGANSARSTYRLLNDVCALYMFLFLYSFCPKASHFLPRMAKNLEVNHKVLINVLPILMTIPLFTFYTDYCVNDYYNKQQTCKAKDDNCCD